MKSVLMRLAVVMMIAAGALVAWADGGPTPGGGGSIAGMKCAPSALCGQTTQQEDCFGKGQGADCNFCDGTNQFRTCVTAQGHTCRTIQTAGTCGRKLTGNCNGGQCTGNQIIDENCQLVQCQ